MRSSGRAGFGIIELLLAAIAGITVVSAVPSYLRGRTERRETSAIASLQAINVAQDDFATRCGGGFFAPSLVDLAKPSIDGGDPFIDPDLSTDPSVKDTYAIALTPGEVAPDAPASCNGLAAGTVVLTYFVAASLPVGAKERFFATNQDGAVYRSEAEVPVTQTGRPAGVTMVQ